MTLEPCPFCGSDDLEHYPFSGGYVKCNSCTAAGAYHDKNGERWNAVSRAVLGAKTPESGAMPWRLQIAAMLWAPVLSDFMPQETIEAADSLIAAHKATEAK